MNTFSPFEKKWMKIFANDIHKQNIQKYIKDTGGYIWHVFSWNLKPEGSFLCGNEARRAFDAEDKGGAQYYEPWPCNGAHEPQYSSPSSAELDELTECYVVSADTTWTYIKTHENDMCGPYFYKLPNC